MVEASWMLRLLVWVRRELKLEMSGANNRGGESTKVVLG